MAKRRAGSQIVNLTPNPEKSRIDPIYLAVDNVRHTVGKLSTRATTLLQTAPWCKVWSQSYGAPKLHESQLAQLRDSHSKVLGKKNHLDVGPMERCKVYCKGEGGGFPQVRAVVSLVCPCCSWLILAPKVLQLCTNHLVWVMCRSVWVSEACQLFLVPFRSSNTPLYPSKCCELGSVPRLLPLLLSFTWTHIWVPQGVGSASSTMFLLYYFQFIFIYLCQKLDHFLTFFFELFYYIFYHAFTQPFEYLNCMKLQWAFC